MSAGARGRFAGRRRLLRAAVAAPAAIALAAAGCGDADDDGSPTPAASAVAGSSPSATGARKPAGSVTMALVTLADQSTDPHVTRSANLAPIVTSCFEQLSRWDAQGKLAPALATRMEESPDHAELVFTLRDGATFWDGSPVTAEDVKWSHERYTRLVAGDTYQATVKAQVESVRATDAKTVVIRMKQPNTLRLSYGIINPRGWNVVSRAHHERVGEDAFRKQPLGSGPFRLVRSEMNQFVELEAYAGHYERVPLAQTIRMDLVPEQATRVARLRTGEAGFIDGIAGPAREEVDGKAGFRIFESPEAALTTLFFQEPEKRPYNDLRVRQAMQLATDQRVLIDTFLRKAGTRSPAAHIFPVTRGYDASKHVPQPFDVAKAKALIAEAGATGAEVRISAYDSSSAPQIPAMVEALAAMWRAIGLNVTFEIVETGAYLTKYSSHQLGGVTALASGAWFDGEALLRTDYLKGQPYAPPMTDEISNAIQRLGEEFDEPRRLAAISDVYRRIIDEAWSVTMPWANSAWAVRSDKVAGWSPAPAWAYPHALETLAPA